MFESGNTAIKANFVVIGRGDGGSSVVHGIFRNLEDAQIYAGEWEADSVGLSDIEIANIDEFDHKRLDAENSHYDQLSIGFGEESDRVIG